MRTTFYLTTEEALQALSESIRQIRLLRNWTQRQLAARAGVSYSGLRRVEDGNSIGLADTLRILEVLSLLGPAVTGIQEATEQARHNALAYAPEAAERKHAYPSAGKGGSPASG